MNEKRPQGLRGWVIFLTVLVVGAIVAIIEPIMDAMNEKRPLRGWVIFLTVLVVGAIVAIIEPIMDALFKALSWWR